jgi:hypothetical protein
MNMDFLCAIAVFAMCLWILGKSKHDHNRAEVLPAVRTELPEYSVDEFGFTEVSPKGEGKTISWSEVQHVGILTTSDGPWFEDVFFIIKTDRGDICLPNGKAMEIQLFEHFKALPGFEYEQVIKAMGCAVDNSFPCWDRSWGMGRQL